jgi:CheY-like chemotaxis protein
MTDVHSPRVGRVTLIVVDQDPARQALTGQKLTAAGYRVVPVPTAGSVLPVVSTERPDLIVLRSGLPDFSGVDLIRALTLLGCPCPAVVLHGPSSGQWLPCRIGATLLRVVAEPGDAFALTSAVASALANREPTPPQGPVDVAHRWAQLVIRGCTVDSDVKTVPGWASRVGVSGGSLREMCRILGIAPHCARDLTRILNATMRAHRYRTTIESVLDASDRRTIDRLLRLSGLSTRGALPSIASLLTRQQWIAPHNAGMRVLTGVFHEPDEALGYLPSALEAMLPA